MRASSKPTVAVVGGGYGGIAVAKALDATADVVLIEPKDAFMHNIAALRALVDPSWLPRVFLPYDRLLENGRVVRSRAELVNPGRVMTASGEDIVADFVVLATGSSYPFPAKTDLVDADAACERFDKVHFALSEAERVLLLGAGPVGIELAGEIKHVWPEKSVTLLDPAADVLAGPFLPELRAELRRQLGDGDIKMLLGSALRDAPPTEPGEHGTFTVATEGGVEVTADIWFRCFGVTPSSAYLGAALLSARRMDGLIAVDQTLRVVGQETVFALGDVATADAKNAGPAVRQAETVAANITALVSGSELVNYEPRGAGIVVPFGPEGGAGQLPGKDEIVGPDVVAEVKGRHLMADRFATMLGSANDRR